MRPAMAKALIMKCFCSCRACLISFQSITIAIFYRYFVIKMNHISDFLCIFAQNLGKVTKKSRK